ncbi:ABC transporter substrate binding protein [Grimontia celer]|uniref:ABC transporter substrate binding protein n=1 Tax=Grimontia celer TaxID=1796497 RepID=UPI0007870DDD|nr:ABC transporter substrate binding protein [Grimontia celer]
MISTICLLLLVSFSSLASDNWPDWLGDTVKQSAGNDWRFSGDPESLQILPARENPKIWVLVSRKAASYDTALKTMLQVYKQEFDAVSFHVVKLPAASTDLNALLENAEANADLLYTVGSKATVAVSKAYQGGELPIVSVNAKDPVLMGLVDTYEGTGSNFAYTSLNLPANVTLSFLLKYMPDLSQIGVLYARTNASAYLTQFLPLQKEAEMRGIRVLAMEVDEAIEDQTLSTVMEAEIHAMKTQDPDLSQSLLWLTGSSSLLSRVDEINQQSSGLPLLTVVPEAVSGNENSALMSVGVSFVNNAHQAALYGIRILRDGEAAGSLPVGVISPPDISISFRQAKRLGKPVPLVLLEMASDVYADDGRAIRSQGMSMEKQ